MGFKRVFDAVGEEECVSKSLPMPSLKYRESLASWFVVDDTAYPIGSADVEHLLLFLADCSRGMKAKISRGKLLAMLESDDSPEMRWFVLGEFKHYRCTLPLFPTQEEAREAHKSSQVVYTTH